jgi:hypothetical protein
MRNASPHDEILRKRALKIDKVVHHLSLELALQWLPAWKTTAQEAK